MQMLLDERIKEGSAPDTQTIMSANQFFLSFGAILFSYGGAASFPVIHFQMFKQDEFSRSVVTSFISEYIAMLVLLLKNGRYRIFWQMGAVSRLDTGIFKRYRGTYS